MMIHEPGDLHKMSSLHAGEALGMKYIYETVNTDCGLFAIVFLFWDKRERGDAHAKEKLRNYC